ncbi:flagellar protein FlgN [Paenibacillus sp. P22]|uniref:flagellar protein FlgN n=1 Tax=Paenibacillus TaxID=44249 RepID=UPI000420F61A|nr:flagellar protein FlgN [Paenibacillus sp. P22]
MPIEAIIDTLEQQDALYSQMIELADQKTPALVKGDLDALNALLMKERKLVKAAGELEERRTTQVNIHFSKLQLRLRSGKLADLIRTVSQPEDKQKLTEIQQELSGKLERLRMKNEHNQQLLRQSLEFIEFSLELASDQPHDDYTYIHPQAGPGGYAKAGMFDRKG